MVHFRVHVEPVLDTLGKVFGDVGEAVGVPPEVLRLGILEEGRQLVVDIRIHLHDAHEVDRVREFVDEDVLRVILVDLVAQHVLLRAGSERELEVTAQAAGPEVPVQGRVVDQVVVLRNVGGAFVAAHHRHAGACLAEGVHHVVRQHGRHGVQRVMTGDERTVRAAPGRAQRNAVHIHILLVPGIQVQGIRRGRDHALGNAEGLHEIHFFGLLLRGRPAAGQDEQGAHGGINKQLFHGRVINYGVYGGEKRHTLPTEGCAWKKVTSCRSNGSRSGKRGFP